MRSSPAPRAASARRSRCASARTAGSCTPSISRTATSRLARETARSSTRRSSGFEGKLDAVVANAGFQHVAPVRDFPEEQWDSLQALLLTSPFLLAKYTWDALAASGDGRFLVVASVHGLVASPFKAGYVAAKHGVLGLVKVLALEGAAVGITASALCPAYVRTAIVEGQIADQAEAHGLPEERVLEDVILAPQAVKRLLEPAEVAEAAAFLLGPGGRSVTGTPFLMDLGW